MAQVSDSRAGRPPHHPFRRTIPARSWSYSRPPGFHRVARPNGHGASLPAAKREAADVAAVALTCGFPSCSPRELRRAARPRAPAEQRISARRAQQRCPSATGVSSCRRRRASLDPAADALRVCRCTATGTRPASSLRRALRSFGRELRTNPGSARNPCCLVAIGRSCASSSADSLTVAPQPLAVMTIASDLATLHHRPPGVDARAHVVATAVLVVHVKAHRAAAARRLDERDARRGPAPRRPPRVDRRRERRLDAAGERKASFSRGAAPATRLRVSPCGIFVFSPPGRNGFMVCPAFKAKEKNAVRGRANESIGALQPVPRRARGPLLDDGAAYIDEAPVAHAGKARRLAGAASQAAIQMQARLLGDLRPLQRALDEVDPAARAVEIVRPAPGRSGRSRCRSRNARTLRRIASASRLRRCRE